MCKNLPVVLDIFQILKNHLGDCLEIFCEEAVVPRCSVEKVFLNTCARVSFLIKLQAWGLQETLAQVFSCEFCEISKNSCSYRTPPVAASVCDIFAATKKFRTWVTFLKSIYKQKQPHRYSINKGVLNKFR